MGRNSGGVRTMLREASRTDTAEQKISGVLAEIRAFGFSHAKPFSIGLVEKRMSDFAQRNGVTLGSRSVYMSPKSIAHARRVSKVEKGLSVSETELTEFPKQRRKMSLYYDTHTKNFTYVSGTSKFVIHPNYEMKGKNGKVRRVNFITAQKLSNNEIFDETRYKRM